MSGMTHGELERAERTLAAQRRQADALDRIANSLEKGVALLEQLVASRSASKPSRTKRSPLDYFHEQLGAVDTGDKAVALWLRARAALQETDKSAEGWALLAKHLVARRRFTTPELATEWLKAQVAQADARKNAPAPNGGSR